MKTAISLEHVPYEGPAVYALALRAEGFRLERFLVPRDGLPGDTGDFLLVMGGPMSVNDAAPWMADELSFIRRAVDRGTPYLGVCLGSQLLAAACGGAVGPGPLFEAGMTALRKTAAGMDDPVLASLPPQASVFEWHGEGIQPPAGAETLVTSEHYATQAFRCQHNAYGLLFHLEMGIPEIERLCAECGDDLARAGRTAEEVVEEARQHTDRMQTWAAAIVQRLAAGI